MLLCTILQSMMNPKLSKQRFVLRSPFSWQCQNLCWLSVAFIVDWRAERKISKRGKIRQPSIANLFFLRSFELFYHDPDPAGGSRARRSEVPGLNLRVQQVWPLTQFFSVSFWWKLIDLPGGQINDPSSGKHCSLLFLPATPSSPSRTLEGLFELTRRPSRALDSPRGLLSETTEKQGHHQLRKSN